VTRDILDVTWIYCRRLHLNQRFASAWLGPWDFFDGQHGRRTKFAKAQGLHVLVRLSLLEETLPLRVIEQRHETEVHVQLLVAVEEGEAGVVGNEINL
jgi:hypothetical protein